MAKLVTKTAYKRKDNILKRAQWLRVYRNLQKDLGASRTTITKAIRWLEERKLIKTELTQLGTIFTVINFDVFQGKIEEEDRYPMVNRCYPMSNAKKGGCYPRSNGGCFPNE